MTERTMLIGAISNAGDRYGYGKNGLIALMNESGTTNTQDVTDEQLSAFVRRHGICVEEVLTGEGGACICNKDKHDAGRRACFYQLSTSNADAS